MPNSDTTAYLGFDRENKRPSVLSLIAGLPSRCRRCELVGFCLRGSISEALEITAGLPSILGGVCSRSTIFDNNLTAVRPRHLDAAVLGHSAESCLLAHAIFSILHLDKMSWLEGALARPHDHDHDQIFLYFLKVWVS